MSTELSRSEAREITERIRASLETLWSAVIEAYERRAHIALGYSTWDEYCRTEFGSNRIRLPREERAETVQSLKESGLSNRAIASATGVDEKTIRNDLAGPSAENSAPSATFIDPKMVQAVEEAGAFTAALNEVGAALRSGIAPTVGLLDKDGTKIRDTLMG